MSVSYSERALVGKTFIDFFVDSFFVKLTFISMSSVDSIPIDPTSISLKFKHSFLYILITTVGILSWLGARTHGRVYMYRSME